MITKFIIEGLDRLGKSTLVDGIQNALGYHEVIHYSKPKILDAYPDGSDNQRKQQYQYHGFKTMFSLLNAPGARLILDRAHLGEVVYSPMYRGYPGQYVFALEERYGASALDDTLLILLTEDMEIARHFVDDGESLGAVENRNREQELFISAFNQSSFKNKKMISVTDPGLGGFKPKSQILGEVLIEVR